MSNLLHSYSVLNRPSNSIFDFSTLSSGSSLQSSNYLRGGLFRRDDFIKSIINRIALDASMIEFKHLTIKEPEYNQTPVKSKLIKALTESANIDQTGRAFIYDVVWSMLDEGYIAIVPTVTTDKLNDNGSYDIEELRVGKITQWYARHVKIRVYNDITGLDQEIILSKNSVAIVESPLLSVLKDDNQTLRLLKQKIEVMYSQDKQVAAGRLNGFIQLPYSTKSSLRKKQATDRKKQIEDELANNQFGIATLDSNEKFIHTGGNIVNNLLEDIRKLQQDFYNQVGMTDKILNGTATPAELNQYYLRAVDPVLQAIIDSINRTFLTKTARTQGQIIQYYRDPFRTLPVEQMATTADVFTRNAIFTPNEVRSIMGYPPHPDPLANRLYNRNIADGNQMGGINTAGPGYSEQQNQNEIFDDGYGGYMNINGEPVDEQGNPL